MDIITNRLLRQAVPLFNALAAVLLALALGVLLKLGNDVFIPLAVALLLAFALAPVANLLQSRLGRGPAVVLSLLLAIAIIVGLGAVIYFQVADLAEQIPARKEVVKAKLQALAGGMAGAGPFTRAGDAISELLAEASRLTAGASGARTPPLVVTQEAASGLRVAAEALGHLVKPFAVMFAVILFTAFMLGQREDIRNRVIRLAGTDDLQQTTAALDDAGARLGRLLLTQVMVNAAFGAVIGGVLWAIGLPSPFLWGILAGVMRFVPYVGAVIGGAAPLAVAFVFDPGWSSLIITAVTFLILDLLVGHVLEPLLYGRSTGLSPLAVVLSATVWAFLWGPLGLVLATPLTICLVVIGRHIPRLSFLATLLGDRPPLEPHEMLYQRLLAGDPAEAGEQARLFLRKRSLATWYDDVALKAIRRAHLDIVRGSVAGDRLERMLASARAIIETLKSVNAGPASRLGHDTAETAAALDRFADDSAARERIDAARLPAGWQGAHPVVILYGAHPLDEVPARMLAQVLERYGVRAKVAALGNCAPDADAFANVRLVCLSFVEPLSTLHLRAASIGVRRKFGGARVVLCIWQQAEAGLIDALRRQLRVDGLVTTTVDALKQVQGMLKG
mgnify:CR=1 FL=1